jgi:signal transduction histidine kinase/CheY-like chemotaxis protein
MGAAVDRFIPAGTQSNPEEVRRARLAVAMSWLTAFFFLVAAVGQAAAGNRRAGAVDVLLAALITIGPFIGKRTGLKTVAHGLMALTFMVLLAMALFVRGAGLSGATLGLALVPLWATLLVGVRAGAVWAALSLAAGVLVGTLGQAQLIVDRLPAQNRLINDHLAMAIATVLLFALAVLYERRKEAALRHVAALEEQKRGAELDRVRAQNDAQLERSERLASLGRIAAATAHEINNPLTYVSSNLQLLAESRALDAETKQHIRQALDGVARIKQIVSDMLLCARPGDDRQSSAALADAVAVACKLAEPTTRTRARVTVEALEALPRVVGSESRLVQVFLNLLVNAAQAMPEGRVREHEIVIGAQVSGDRIVAEVRDDGRGIPPELIDRVMEPFFTTKAVGEGTGLGLALCEGIVRSFGGTMGIESVPGRTVVRIGLPMAEAPPAPEPVPLPPPTPVPSTARWRVLVVDDEDDVARAIGRLLPPEAVTVAHSGREALALLDEGQRFDLILCDVMMPDLTGMDVFEGLRRQDRDAAEAMVFMTAGTFTDRTQRFRNSVPNLFLDKPIAMTTLRALMAAHEAPKPGAAASSQSATQSSRGT